MTQIRSLADPQEMSQAQRVLMQVWQSETCQLDAATMQALAHTGNYVAGVYASDDPGAEMIGCGVGFFTAPQEHRLHSHIVGIVPRFAGRGLGTAVKQHQRDWCRVRGITSISWTFDPGIARNAYVNFTKLGTRAEAYLEDFYGSLVDGLNAGSPSDRLLVSWDLTTPRPTPGVIAEGPVVLRVGANGEPVAAPDSGAGAVAVVEVPTDLEQIRRTDPGLAHAWRLALREVLEPYVAAPAWRVSGFLRRGAYVIQRQP